MDTLLVVAMMDPIKSFQYHCALRRQRSRGAALQSTPNKFWQSPKLRNWSSTQNSALTIVSGNYQARYVVRDFCVDVIKQLNDAAVPVLLALKAPREDSDSAIISTIDVLKYLVRQAITLSRRRNTEKGMALKCASVHDADTATKWFEILQGILADIGHLVYIVVDLELLAIHLEPSDGAVWVQQFQSMFEDFTRRGIGTKVKVVLVSCSPLPFQLTDTDRATFLVQARSQVMTTRQRKAGRAQQLSKVPFRLQEASMPPRRISGMVRSGNHMR